MSGESQESKEQGSSTNPLSYTSSGPSGATSATHPTTPHASGKQKSKNATNPASLKSRKVGEAKTQKPSFLSLIFCCGANFVDDSDGSLHVGTGPSRPASVSIGKAAGKKPVAKLDEKVLPSHPTPEEVVATTAIEERDVEHIQSQEIELNGLLGPVAVEHKGKKCLVLDLDETLVHSSFKLVPQADYVVPVEIDNQVHNVYVLKRPGVDTFLEKMGELFEVVIFTASVSKYADPVLDMLDVNRVIKHRLFRESCFNHKGNYVKDLSVIGRDLRNTIIIDNSPACYIFHQTNAVPITTWFNDPHDTELLDLIPFLTDMTVVDDVNPILDMGNEEQ
ncbi:hypothetical protein CPC16_009800 [Podila verticillata]|nr:hypothetical protein CPC16_009800 [Podila verticillata]KAI9235482.1 MAG: HAD-like domain-containing protein [Podila humilis]